MREGSIFGVCVCVLVFVSVSGGDVCMGLCMGVCVCVCFIQISIRCSKAAYIVKNVAVGHLWLD